MSSIGAMRTFPETMRFRGVWRNYQARLLEEMQAHLHNQRLHIVAAPGSGKTVFGLEVVRRLNQPTLVLTPTLTTRNQWAERLSELFLDAGETRQAWVSTNLRQPALLTVSTYQALHALCGENPQSLPAALAEAGFQTLVVDEAHHLRADWWRTLTFVAEALPGVKVVALTATPPYDVSPSEWRRYEEFCGPVDAEVSVPELVAQGDLCPHQDYVYFSLPTEKERTSLDQFRTGAQQFVERLRGNQDFALSLLDHPWMTDPEKQTEAILEDSEWLSGMAVYLNAVGAQIPSPVLRVLGIKIGQIPSLSLRWLEILLERCLYADTPWFLRHQQLLKGIRHELHQMGAISRRRVYLQNPPIRAELLTTSATKLKSIEEIVRMEWNSLGTGLRCVVLTDYIRKSEMPQPGVTTTVFEDMGAVPVFETLRTALPKDVLVAVLTGSLVIVPARCETRLREITGEGVVMIRTLPHDETYVTVEFGSEDNHRSVTLLTRIFQEGGIQVMIGTKSLLGEGWDAPAINTLILASFVGSYVTSNQMRGRSIRIDPRNPRKAANIWHLVCAEPGIFGPGEDFELLARRCRAFVGVSAVDASIGNGVARLGCGSPPFGAAQIPDLNAQTRKRALDREGLRERWRVALESGTSKEISHAVEAPEDAAPRTFVLRNTILALFLQAASVFGYVFSQTMRSGGNHNDTGPFTVVAVAAAVAALASLPYTARAIWRLVRHGSPEGSMAQVGRAVLESLGYAGALDRKSGDYAVLAERNGQGAVSCWIRGGTRSDHVAFVRAMREALRRVDNPRYLLARHALWRVIGEDYFAVPEVLARKKETALYFADRWKRYVGPVKLVYTRTPEGRAVLLRARMRSLAAAFDQPADSVMRWK